MNTLKVQRNATPLLCLSLSNSHIKIFEKSKPAYEFFRE